MTARIYQFPSGLKGPNGMALLRIEGVWREKAFPDREWVISGLPRDQYGRQRVTIEPINDRTREANYAESYFRRHFELRAKAVSKKNSAAHMNFRASTKRGFQKLVACTLEVESLRVVS